MARFRGPQTSKTFLQWCIILFVLSLSFAVLFLVMNVHEGLACDYTGAVESCEEQPFYRSESDKQNALKDFDIHWLIAAQEYRNQTEVKKCDAEAKLIEDLTASHRDEANRIIRMCMSNYQRCVDDLGITTTTTTTTTVTTQFVLAQGPTTTLDLQSRCQLVADASFRNTGDSGVATSAYMNCITGGQDQVVSTLPAGQSSHSSVALNCDRCDKFCRSFNWTQEFPDYARQMNFSGSCTAKVCPWIPECVDGVSVMNLHRNCSACPCHRATCIPGFIGSSPTGGGRLLGEDERRDQATSSTTTTTTSPVLAERQLQSDANAGMAATEFVANDTCRCQSGVVDTVLVGRPFKTFYTEYFARRRGSFSGGSFSGGRRMVWDEEAPVEYMQGVYIEMEEELPSKHERTFECQAYFSDRYKYVYPRTQGEAHTLEALLARQSHPDLGCGYSGQFKVTCEAEMGYVENETGSFNFMETGNCSYKVDISTCTAPTYQEALDSCYSEEAMGVGQLYVPTIGDFMCLAAPGTPEATATLTVATVPRVTTTIDVDTTVGFVVGREVIIGCGDDAETRRIVSIGSLTLDEALTSAHAVGTPVVMMSNNLTTSDVVPEHIIPVADLEECCQVHVGSECVPDRNYNGTYGTINGTWQADMSYARQTAYFPNVRCAEQAELKQHVCPRVNIYRFPNALAEAYIHHCDWACNLTWARKELDKVCDNDVFPDTRSLEAEALKSKISLMTAGRASLERWSRSHWPLVGETQHFHDCIDESARRYNMIGMTAYNSGFDKLKLRYECRVHGCSSNQCIKVTRKCPIPQMSSEPESTCGPFGDPNTYMCVDKVHFATSGTVTGPLGYGFLGASLLCLFSSLGACFQAYLMRKNAQVLPYLPEPESKVCEACNEIMDDIDVEEGLTVCSKCTAKANRPDVCSNCGTKFENKEDNVCTECGAPRDIQGAELMDASQNVCPQCGYPLGENDGKCAECGWHPGDAIVVRADNQMSPLRANAASAANEQRIVPVDIDSPTGSGTGMLMISGQE